MGRPSRISAVELNLLHMLLIDSLFRHSPLFLVRACRVMQMHSLHMIQ
jgi:hypothetical protein